MSSLLTPRQLAELLHCKSSTIYAWAKEGRIPAYKLNGLLRFDPKEIEDWLKQNRLQPLDLQKEARRIMKMDRRVDIDTIIKKNIDEAKKNRYISLSKGKPDQSGQKGGDDGSL